MKGKIVKKDGKPYFKVAGRPVLPAKQGEVQYPVGYRYNGGIIVNDEWVQGFIVDSPKVPKGFKLRNIGVGLQLNCRPPIATSYLEKT
jgi:hypothetical protein